MWQRSPCGRNKIQYPFLRDASSSHVHVPFGVTYEKIGTIQRRLAWPLHKDDTLSRSGRSTDLNIYFILFFILLKTFSNGFYISSACTSHTEDGQSFAPDQVNWHWSWLQGILHPAQDVFGHGIVEASSPPFPSSAIRDDQREERRATRSLYAPVSIWVRWFKGVYTWKIYTLPCRHIAIAHLIRQTWLQPLITPKSLTLCIASGDIKLQQDLISVLTTGMIDARKCLFVAVDKILNLPPPPQWGRVVVLHQEKTLTTVFPSSPFREYGTSLCSNCSATLQHRQEWYFFQNLPPSDQYDATRKELVAPDEKVLMGNRAAPAAVVNAPSFYFRIEIQIRFQQYQR